MLIPIGIKENKFVLISQVDRGTDCGCTCPDCGRPLIARKGDEKQHHFAHASSTHPIDCTGNVESAIHLFAKQLISDAGYIQAPNYKVELPAPNTDLQKTFPARRLEFLRVEIEERMLFGKRRIDVVGYTNTDRLLIEIFVTHRTRGKKLSELRAANEATLEIKIPYESLFPHSSSDTNKLIYCILESINNKEWLHHPEGEIAKAELIKQAKTRASEQQIRATEASKNTVNSEQKESIHKSHVMPTRYGHSKEDYVRELHAFLTTAYNEDEFARIVPRLKVGGTFAAITQEDEKIAFGLGLSFDNQLKLTSI